MQEVLKHGNHIYEVVDFIPYGYHIWNIGKHMKEDYLPLVQVGGYDGCQVIGIKKALPLKNAQVILSVIGSGDDTPEKMKKYIKEHELDPENQDRVKLMIESLEILQSVKGAKNL